MADFVAVIRRAVDGLSDNNAEFREKVYEKARRAVRRQLEAINPRPSDGLVKRQLEKLELAIASVESRQPPDATSVLVDPSVGELVTPEAAPPTPPEGQELGPHFEVSSEGRLAIVPAVTIGVNEVGATRALRRGLIEAADELIAATIGSNAFQHIHKLAVRYREVLGDSESDTALDLLYMYGVRLQNSAKRTSAMIAANDYPEMSPVVGEALDTLVALHGPMIMSTQVGRSLVEKSRLYLWTPEQVDSYRTAAYPVIESALTLDILEQESGLELRALIEEAGQGPVPAQSTSLAASASSNLISACATLALGGVGYVVLTGLAGSVPAEAATGAVTSIVDAVWLLFTNNQRLLFDIAAASGADLTWLPSFVRWAELNRIDAVARQAVVKSFDKLNP